MPGELRHEALVRRIRELENRLERLQTSESRLKTLVDTIPDPVWLKDPDGVYILCNAQFERLIGAREEDIRGKTDHDFVDPERADAFRRNDAVAIEGDRPLMNEERLTFADGYTGIFETLKTPMKSPGGHPIGVLGIAREITRRKETEGALKETEKRLRDAQEMVRLGFWFWDVLTGEVEWSQEVYRIFRRDPETFRPQIDTVLALSPWPEERQRGEELIRRAVESKTTGTYEQRFLFPDGSIGYYVSTFRGVYDTQGDLVAIKGTVQDITEKKRSEEEQRKMAERLKQVRKMEAIGRLAGGVAHDFNNMLSIIMGNVEIVMEDVGNNSPLWSRLLEIHRAGERSINLTRQLLAFARKQTIEPQVLDLNRTIDEMLKMLQRLIGEDIDLVWQPRTPLDAVKIDPSQMDQALVNLCINARDAIAGVGKVTIETGHAVFDEEYCRDHPGFVPGRFVMIAVSDDGAGMDTLTLENLFEPFFTTKDRGRGSGLGLATVYGIVKQNRGFINVYSEPEKGSTFKLYFPSLEGVTAPESVGVTPEKLSGGSETILLVEDEAAILHVTRIMLERFGYTVLTASTPGEALDIARSPRTIHLLMTDVVMPEMNGRELSKKILALYPDLKCLFMSGYTENVIAHHGVLDPGIAFLNKPFSRSDLSKKLREVLGGAGA